MRTTVTILGVALAGAGALAVFPAARHDMSVASVSLKDDDPVAASFVRELNRQPGAAAPAQGLTIDEDELYRLVNSIHWTRDAANSEDENRERSNTNEDR